MPGSIRAVLFDAGATLIHPDPPVEQVYARMFSEDGASCSAEALNRAFAQEWAAVHAEPAGDRFGGVRGEAAFWRGFLTRVRGRVDGGTVSEEAFARLASHFRSAGSWAIYGDVLPTLETLDRGGFALAVVSNWDSNLPPLLQSLDLARFFRTVSVSAIEQTGKPEPEIFRRTCERLGVSPSEALHVGDSPREDYEGARGAGLEAVLLDRKDEHRHVPQRIRSLSELRRRV